MSEDNGQTYEIIAICEHISSNNNNNNNNKQPKIGLCMKSTIYVGCSSKTSFTHWLSCNKAVTAAIKTNFILRPGHFIKIILHIQRICRMLTTVYA